MAGDWIKIRKDLITDPDVINIAAKCGTDEFSVCGRLVAIWSWLDSHSIDGRRVPITDQFLDRLTGLSGFSAAMRCVGWLTGNAGSITFPGYEKHNGETAKKRAVEQKKKHLQRENRRGQMSRHDGDKCPDEMGTREEKRREDINTVSLTRVIPCWEFVKGHAEKIGLIEWKARDWFDSMESSGWVDSNGNPIMKWDAALNRIKTFWEADGRPMTRPAMKNNINGTPNGKPQQPAHFNREGIQPKVLKL